MKKACKLITILLLICLAFASLAGCACKKDAETDDTVPVNGSNASWQNLTVFVPEGMELVGGSALDSTDPNTAWIQRRGDELSYFLVNIVEKDKVDDTIKTTKELNSGEDIEFNAGDLRWKGVKYKYAGVSDCFQVYTEVNGRAVLVSGSRFAFDSPEAKAVLASIKLAD